MAEINSFKVIAACIQKCRRLPIGNKLLITCPKLSRYRESTNSEQDAFQMMDNAIRSKADRDREHTDICSWPGPDCSSASRWG